MVKFRACFASSEFGRPPRQHHCSMDQAKPSSTSQLLKSSKRLVFTTPGDVETRTHGSSLGGKGLRGPNGSITLSLPTISLSSAVERFIRTLNGGKGFLTTLFCCSRLNQRSKQNRTRHDNLNASDRCVRFINRCSGGSASQVEYWENRTATVPCEADSPPERHEC
jgi:hypothetical protein